MDEEGERVYISFNKVNQPGSLGLTECLSISIMTSLSCAHLTSKSHLLSLGNVN